MKWYAGSIGDVANKWYTISVTDNKILAGWNWCCAHTSDGRFGYSFDLTPSPYTFWYFEREKDALLFALIWGGE